MNHRIFIASSDIAFECAVDESVLNAATRAGIELPYSCRKGACGNCVGTVTQGEVGAVGSGSTVNESCLPGQVLLCMSAPRSDLEIAPTSWRRINPTPRRRFTAKVFRNELAAPDVSVLKLRLPAGQRAKFKAGQYLELSLPDGSTRSYSMANAPHESDTITLHVRHVPGGNFTQRVPRLECGDLLEIELPYGAFCLQENDKPIVMVAGGTGFAPIRSLLDDMHKRGIERLTTLIWGARRTSGIYMPEAVEKWRKKWPDFRFVGAVSEAEGALPADMVVSRVDQALASFAPDLTGHELYCCGAPPMVAAVRNTAIGQGLAPQDFHSDVFVEGPASMPPSRTSKE